MNITVSRSDINSGEVSYGNILAATSVVVERVHTKAGAKMASGNGDGIDGFPAQFVGDLT